MVDLGDLPGAVLGVGRAAEGEAGVHAQALQMGDLRQDLRGRAQGVDAVELEADRLRARGVHRLLVHAAGVKVAHHPLGRRALVALGGGALAQHFQVLLVAVPQLIDGAPVRIGRRHLGLLQPGAIGVTVEVVLRLDRRVEVGRREIGAQGGGEKQGGGRGGEGQAHGQRLADAAKPVQLLTDLCAIRRSNACRSVSRGTAAPAAAARRLGSPQIASISTSRPARKSTRLEGW